MGSYVSCLYEKEQHDSINEQVSFEENDVLMKFFHPIHLPVYLYWPATDVKCWVPVDHVLRILSIPTVNTSRQPYTFLKSELKDTQKQFTENLWTWKHSFMHIPIEICSSTSNSVIIIENFWKQLALIDMEASFFVLFGFIPAYFNEFIYEMMKWNISKIKHHSYEVLNLQVYWIALVLIHGNL